jgi:hypothetical protein
MSPHDMMPIMIGQTDEATTYAAGVVVSFVFEIFGERYFVLRDCLGRGPETYRVSRVRPVTQDLYHCRMESSDGSAFNFFLNECDLMHNVSVAVDAVDVLPMYVS